MNRRGFLKSILAAGAAPAFVRAGSLMPLWIPAWMSGNGLLIDDLHVALFTSDPSSETGVEVSYTEYARSHRIVFPECKDGYDFDGWTSEPFAPLRKLTVDSLKIIEA